MGVYMFPATQTCVCTCVFLCNASSINVCTFANIFSYICVRAFLNVCVCVRVWMSVGLSHPEQVVKPNCLHMWRIFKCLE